MNRICGLDEVGRGPLAGPLVAAGVILNGPIDNLNDSKKLSAKVRAELFKNIIESGAVVEVEIISTTLINKMGISWANKIAFKRLIERIEADKYVVDGNLKFKGLGTKRTLVESVIKADARIESVMAASIVAKETRDGLMKQLHEDFPEYGWIDNMGYGTKFHIEALKKFGMCRYHRTMFVNTALG